MSPRCNERYVQWCSYAISRTYALSGHRYLAKCFLFFAFPIFYRKDIFPGIKGNSFLQIMQDYGEFCRKSLACNDYIRFHLRVNISEI